MTSQETITAIRQLNARIQRDAAEWPEQNARFERNMAEARAATERLRWLADHPPCCCRRRWRW